jgi:imidazole glycerol phosphate synthase glutamine amidotransferase subunit
VRTGIIDYGGGNLRSVANALRALGQDPVIIANPDQVGDATHLLLPGQGEFGDTMARLEARGLASLLTHWIAADRPYFGICVGYQILFDSSEEAPGVSGLGVVSGKVRRFQLEDGLKIPHMGWNSAMAVRGETEGNPTNPSLWYVDVTRSGTVCLYDLATVRLWRPGAPDTITYRMFHRENGTAVDVTFDETVTVAALDPARLPIVEGAPYTITGPDNATSAQVSFVLLEGDFEAADALGEALLAKGCTVQLELLAAGLEDEAEASGG